jgi:uncharacterized protein YkwD
MPIHLCGVLLALAVASCGGSGAGIEIPDSGPWYPPATPRHPERLSLRSPGETDPQRWWAANILVQTPVEGYDSAEQAEFSLALIAEANRVRVEHGLGEVVAVDLLNRVAQAHAMDLAVRDYWNHLTPEGLHSWDRIKAAGGGTVIAGAENSAINTLGAGTPERVIDGWMHSAGHRALLLNPAVRYTGVGTYNYSPTEFSRYIMLLVDLEPKPEQH